MVPADNGAVAVEIKVTYRAETTVPELPDLDEAQTLLTQVYTTAFAELTERLEKKA
jgi:hypothetical protein